MTRSEAILAAALLARRESDHHHYLWPRTADDDARAVELWDLATAMEDDVRRADPEAFEAACEASHAWVYGVRT